MTRQAGAAIGVLFLGMLFLAHAAAAQFVQQGSKLVGTGAVGAAGLGQSVAFSADGNVAIVGGPNDDNNAGAVWVYTRSGGVWMQQGSKLVGSGATGKAMQGYSVAISADGNTAIVGGPNDQYVPTPDYGLAVGAAWVYTRSGGVWSQQGSKLVGTDAAYAAQGTSVAISADGNTAIVGGPQDNGFYSPTGAAWVFTRTGGVWSQQGSKLVGTEAVYAAQGTSVAISADGNTAIVGGPTDNNPQVGAAWVFSRSAGTWTQQGGKLVGADVVGWQGWSVAISADGNTAIVGGPGDGGVGPSSRAATGINRGYYSATGAASVFTRSGGVWSQQGGKLVGTGALGAWQGWSVAISVDGNKALIGGPADSFNVGAAWVFTRSQGIWSQQGNKFVATGAVGAAQQGTSLAISADGTTAILGGPSDDSSAGAAWVFSTSAFGVWAPVASHNPGKNNSQWRSDLGLLNPGAVTANVQIEFFGSGGVVSTTTYVPPGVQSVLTDVVGQVGASGSGAIEVLSDQPLKVTARTYNQVPSDANCYASGTQGQDYPVVATGDGLGAGQSAYLAGLAENASYRCNIGLVNVGSGSAFVYVELYDGAGTKLTDYAILLALGQWAQETQPFKNFAGQTAMDRGYARVTVQFGAGVFAFASVIDNITNDPTTVAMQR